MLISICYLILKGLLQTTSDGSTKLMDFLDEQRMCRLYEKFILEYYRKEHPEIRASASQIPWDTDDDYREMLPVMQSDIMLKSVDKTLVIDAKYYAHTTQSQYNTNTLHSGNLYQIFTYVKILIQATPVMLLECYYMPKQMRLFCLIMIIKWVEIKYQLKHWIWIVNLQK